MPRRSKNNTEYWSDRMDRLFKLDPDMKLIENRYKCLKLLLQKKYQLIMESVSEETMIEFIRDTTYLDRECRRKTEDIQQSEKIILSQEYKIETGYQVPLFVKEFKEKIHE